MRKLILCALCALGFLEAQSPTNFDQLFSVAKTTALSSAAEVITVQHAANSTSGGVTVSTKNVKFASAYLYCSVTCTITLERNGVTATSPNLTINNVNPANITKQTTTSTAYSNSNVGTGTVINTYQLGAGTYVSIDMSLSQMQGGVADNLTFRTNSITGTVQIQVMWYEL